jgi:hypothetical protein
MVDDLVNESRGLPRIRYSLTGDALPASSFSFLFKVEANPICWATVLQVNLTRLSRDAQLNAELPPHSFIYFRQTSTDPLTALALAAIMGDRTAALLLYFLFLNTSFLQKCSDFHPRQCFSLACCRFYPLLFDDLIVLLFDFCPLCAVVKPISV